MKINVKDTFRHIVCVLLKSDNEYAQTSFKKGLKRHGVGVEATVKEYAQLGEKDKRVFIPMKISELTREQKRKSLRILSLIKDKRCRKIKGRVVADGRKQRVYMMKEEVASPTVHLESFLVTLIVDTYEKRDVAMLDVGGVFLLSKIMEFVLIKMEGEEVDVMISANPEYAEFVTYEKGKKVL